MHLASKRKKDGKMIDILIFAILLVVYSVVTFSLFYHQTWGSDVSYNSDMLPYILEITGADSGYSFPYPLFFKFGALLNTFLATPQLAAAVALTILNSLSLVITKYYADKVIMPIVENKKAVVRIFVTFLVFALFFVSMLYLLNGSFIPGIYSKYRGVFSPNPYHNATYLATRPFAIATFFIYIKLLKDYEKKTELKDHIFFSIFLFLTTIAKPSFTFVFVPTAGLIMLYRMFKRKFKNFWQTFKLGLCFIPTFIALIYQFFGVFGPVEEGERGIGFGLARAWSYHCDNIPLAMILAMAFPLAVLIINFKKLKGHGLFRFTWQITLVSVVEVLVLYEKGFRESHMNFSWGYMHGLFFAFWGSAIFLFEKTYKSLAGKDGKILSMKNILLLGQWILFVLHLICGLYYFNGLYNGANFY